jgi:hypothetical protein
MGIFLEGETKFLKNIGEDFNIFFCQKYSMD